MPQAPPPGPSTPIPVTLVYWGRLGAGVVLTMQISEALARDSRFCVSVSVSPQSEAPVGAFESVRVFPMETFAGLWSFLIASLAAPERIRRLVDDLTNAGTRAAVTIMPHIWGAFFQRAAQRAGIRTLLIVHDASPHPGERRPVFDWLARREIRGADRLITFSRHVADTLIQHATPLHNRLTNLYIPTITYGVRSTSKMRTPMNILFFGRILPYKGIPLLLEAYARLKSEGMSCNLRIVGRGEFDVPDALRSLPGLSIEQGWVDSDAIGEILVWADVIVLPYVEASQSGVVPAAYGAGVPVVVTPVGGLIEQVVHGETGLVATDVTAAALADAIRTLAETPGLHETCRNGAARYAAEHAPSEFAVLLGDAIVETLSEQT